MRYCRAIRLAASPNSRMLDILAITTPIYVIILLGYIATRTGLFARLEMRTFGKFVINLALPALVFNAIAQRKIADILHPAYLLACLGGSLIVLGAAYLSGKKLAGMAQADAIIYAMGMSCSNSSFIGYPILLLTLAPVAGVALAMNVLVENVVMLPLIITLAESGGDGGGARKVLQLTLARLVRNPLIIALSAGLLVSLLEWQLPAPLGRTVTLFAQASGALSLFVIGGTLVGLPMRGMAGQVAPIVAGKLVLHPLAVALVMAALPYAGIAPAEPALRHAAVMMAAMPMMSIYPIVAQAYGLENRSAAALVLTTSASFFTLSALLWLG